MFLVLVSLNYYCDDYILLKVVGCDIQITKAVKKLDMDHMNTLLILITSYEYITNTYHII